MNPDGLKHLAKTPAFLLFLVVLSLGSWGFAMYVARAQLSSTRDLLQTVEPDAADLGSVRNIPERVWQRDAFRSVSSQNVFSENRRPFPKSIERHNLPTPTPLPTPVIEELQDFKFELSGILSFGNRFKKAFLNARSGGEQINSGFAEGEDVGGYIVHSIASKQVILTRNESEAITLKFERFGEGGVFESSYAELFEDFQIDDGEKVFEETYEDGSSRTFTKHQISGTEVKQSLTFRPEVLQQKVDSGEVTVSVSGMDLDFLPQSMGGTGVRGGSSSGGSGELVISGVTIRRSDDRAGASADGGGDSGYEVISGQKVKREGGSRGSGVTISGVRRRN